MNHLGLLSNKKKKNNQDKINLLNSFCVINFVTHDRVHRLNNINKILRKNFCLHLQEKNDSTLITMSWNTKKKQFSKRVGVTKIVQALRLRKV